MPVKILNCYIAMMPVIEAKETLLNYHAVTCGVGPKSKKQAQQMKKQVREWIKTMSRYSKKVKTNKAASFEEMKAMLESMGIRVKGENRG